ncbi:hypothetical protein EVAR_71642_1, partial [Eumeta japonica]
MFQITSPLTDDVIALQNTEANFPQSVVPGVAANTKSTTSDFHVYQHESIVSSKKSA